MNPFLNKMADGKVKSETKKNDDMFDDIVVAAQALMQLNGENNNIVRKRREKRISSEEVDQKPNNNNNNKIFKPKKVKKYRSLAEIYKETTSIDTENFGTKVKFN